MNLRQTIDLYFGGPGSGCDPETAAANGTKCGRPPGSGTKDGLATFKELKGQWADINNQLLHHVDRPDSPEANALMDKLRSTVKEIHKLDVDPGGWEGIGLPGGARDLLVIGAGPGGLTSALMGASDGLDTLFIEAQPTAGGQSKFSSRVENYPGFPVGITGEKLASNIYEQATRMGAEGMLGVRVTGLTYDEKTGLKTVTLSNGKTETARSVVIAGGLEFRKMNFPGSDAKGIIYGDGNEVKELCIDKDAVIVGGSNGAAQAALGAATVAKHVYLLSRSPIVKAMSDYQVNQVYRNQKITVIENDEILETFSDKNGHVNEVLTKSGKRLPTSVVGMFVGSSPNMNWLPHEIKKTDGKINVNHDLETDIPGVYAIGDNRVGSSPRIGTAVGDGQMVARNVFQYFDREKKKLGIAASKSGKLSVKAFNQLIDQLFDMDKIYPFLGQTVG